MHCERGCCDVKINTDPWCPQCPTCKSVSKQLNFNISNNINSTQYIQALRYINGVHQLFNNAMTNHEAKFSLPEVPNFLSLFSTPNSDGKEAQLNKPSDAKKKPKLGKATISNKNLMLKKEKSGRKKVRKSTSEHTTSINSVDHSKKWYGVDSRTSNVMRCCPVLITQELTGTAFESHSTDKAKTNKKTPSIKKIPSTPKDKYVFRSQPGNFLHYSSDNIVKLKKELSPPRIFDKKRDKNKLKTPPCSKNESTRHVQMQTSQCWSTQKFRQGASGLSRNDSANQLRSVRPISRKLSKRSQKIKTEYFENFVPMNKNVKRLNNVVSERSETTVGSKLSSLFKYESSETLKLL